jgi:DnaJ-class molecular chaperone
MRLEIGAYTPHHPDKNPGDAATAERFRAVNSAYEVHVLVDHVDPARKRKRPDGVRVGAVTGGRALRSVLHVFEQGRVQFVS